MDLWAAQADEKRLLFPGSVTTPPCHPDRKAAQWRDLRFDDPSLGMFCSATTVPGSTALPFVISTGAQRSGEICGSTVPPWECSDQLLQSPEAPPSPLSSRPERSAVERSAVRRSLLGNVLFSNYSPRKHRPPFCHLDRSAAQWRDLRFLQRSPANVNLD
jgi:hypothetical protein